MPPILLAPHSVYESPFFLAGPEGLEPTNLFVRSEVH